MLDNDQKQFIDSLSKDEASRRVQIEPYNPTSQVLAEEIISKIKNVLPKVEVLLMGSAGLGIDGERDLDLFILCPKDLHDEAVLKLVKLFGATTSSRKWHWRENDFDISLFLFDPENPKIRQWKETFQKLKRDERLLKKYEDLKKSLNSKTHREYEIAKQEFFNKLQVNGFVK